MICPTAVQKLKITPCTQVIASHLRVQPIQSNGGGIVSGAYWRNVWVFAKKIQIGFPQVIEPFLLCNDTVKGKWKEELS
jgi:hypothetical protein